MLSHEEYLKMINERANEALQSPFASLLTGIQKDLFRVGFLNGCHALQDYYLPIVNTQKNEIEALQADVQSYVEQENGEST